MSKRINPNLKRLAELTYDPNLKVDESIFVKQEEVKRDTGVSVLKEVVSDEKKESYWREGMRKMIVGEK